MKIVPYPYDPPSNTPLTNAVKSIAILVTLTLGPLFAIPVIIPSRGPGPRPDPIYMPTPIAKRTVPKYKYPCLMIIDSGVGIKYIVRSRTLPIVRIFKIVPKNGFCLSGIQPSRTIKPVMTPANPIRTLISLLNPS